MKTESKRYLLIDSIRGCALISMILYHFCYDIYIVYGRNPVWNHIFLVHWWQQSICCTFILISGISWHFVRKKGKQGFYLNFWGLVITAVTWFVLPKETIWFGILNFMGCALLCLTLLEPAVRKIDARMGVTLSLLFFALTRHIARGELALFSLRLSSWLYTPKITTVFGFPHPGFVSSDYFPLFPWFFLYLAGYFLWKLIKKYSIVKSISIPVVSIAGRHTLPLYLLHQPLCMAVAWLLSQSW